MPEFYAIIALKIFHPIFLGGAGEVTCPPPHYAPPVSYTYASNMLIPVVNFTNIIIVPVCIVEIAHGLSMVMFPMTSRDP